MLSVAPLRRSVFPLGAFVALALTLAVGCGQGGGEQRPAPPEQAFLQSMVPHHASAVKTAELARREGESRYVRGLSEDIVDSQASEIEQMGRIHRRLFAKPLRPDMGAHAKLGLSAQEAGMDHMDGAAMIRGARPFDRAFVDHMVPHHRGAVRMAQVVLDRTRDRELRGLAESIVAAQRREIAEMTAFRKREYGGPPPAGGAHSGAGALQGAGSHG